MSVLVLGAATDPEAVRVAEEVRARGGRVFHLDTAAFPAALRMSSRGASWTVNSRDTIEASVVYLRGLGTHPLWPGLEGELAERPRGLIAQCMEKRALLESLVKHCERRGALIVNTLEANEQHSRKPYQIELLEEAGLPVPRSLVTNDPRAVRAFASLVGNVVYKPLAGGATVQRLLRKDLSNERLGALANAPVLFQELVEGTPIRAYVVNGRVIAAAEIHSPELDYRRNEESVQRTQLTRDEALATRAAARACGMRFTGVDLIRGARDFKVLECNPSPMFAVFEQKTGADIGGPLAKFLVKSAAR